MTATTNRRRWLGAAGASLGALWLSACDKLTTDPKVSGYCPLAAYLGSHGFCLELALRPGVQHSASETEFNFENVIPMAQRLSAVGPKAPILLRLDSGFDSAHLTRAIEACNRPGLPQVDFLVKWNPRTTDVQALAARLDGWTASAPRAGSTRARASA